MDPADNNDFVLNPKPWQNLPDRDKAKLISVFQKDYGGKNITQHSPEYFEALFRQEREFERVLVAAVFCEDKMVGFWHLKPLTNKVDALRSSISKYKDQPKKLAKILKIFSQFICDAKKDIITKTRDQFHYLTKTPLNFIEYSGVSTCKTGSPEHLAAYIADPDNPKTEDDYLTEEPKGLYFYIKKASTSET